MATVPLLADPPAGWVYDVPLPSRPDGLRPYLEAVLARCREAFGADGASVFLASGRPGEFTPAAGVGRAGRIPPDAVVREGEGIAGWVLREGTPRRVDDPAADPDLAPLGVRRADGIGSSLIVPLLAADGARVGVMNLARSDAAPAFEDADLAAAQTLGRHVALAVHNAQLMAAAVRSAEEQRRAHEALRGVLGAVGTALVVLDAEGLVGAANPAASALGIHPPRVGGHRGDWLAELAPSLAEAIEQSAAAAVAGRAARARVSVPDRPGAADRVWAIEAQPLAGGGAVLAVQDITEHAAWQAERDRLARLAEIGQMTAAIAHEIRNPLTGIASAAQMIRMAPESAVEFAGVVEEEAQRLNGLCDEFLAFARPAALAAAPTRLGEIARRVIKREEAPLRARGLGVSLEIDPGEPRINLDPSRMDQVLTNLLHNARDASPDGGRIAIVVGRGRLEVRDTGPGLDEDQVTRLFTPFFTTKPQGTGLGLSVVRKLVEAHGARISVEPNPGGGACFAVNFPPETWA